MREHGITNQAHFVETAQGIETQREKFDWYRSAGALGPDFLFGHFVHPTDVMVSEAAATGCGVVWQATSNGRLGSGFADVVRLREAGIPGGARARRPVVHRHLRPVGEHADRAVHPRAPCTRTPPC